MTVIINIFQQTTFLGLRFPTSRMRTVMPDYLTGVMMITLEQSLAALWFRVSPLSDGAALPFS